MDQQTKTIAETDDFVEDIKPGSKIRALIFGAPKVGKTHFAGTFPSPAFADMDNGIDTLANHIFKAQYPDKRIRYKTFSDPVDKKGIWKSAKALQKMQEKLNEWADNPEVETIVLDSLTTMSALAVHLGLVGTAEVGQSKTLEQLRKNGMAIRKQADFGAEMGIIEQIMEWVSKKENIDKHVLVLAHERFEYSDLGGISRIDPLVTGQLRSKLAGWFGEVWYMQTEGSGDKLKRSLVTQSKHPLKGVGSRLGLPAVITDPTFEKVQTLVREAQGIGANVNPIKQEVK